MFPINPKKELKASPSSDDVPSSSKGPASTQGTSTDSSSGSSESPDIDVVSATPQPRIAGISGGLRIPTVPSGLFRGFGGPESQVSQLPPSLRPSGGGAGGGPVKRYLCQRCLNHGEHWPRKGHKPFCRWAACNCDLCRMVDERRRLNNAICRQGGGQEDERGVGSKVRNPMCARCSAHGLQNRLRGHKKRCPYTTCDCDLCKLVDERRDLMAKQIKLRRQQKADLGRVETTPILPPPPPQALQAPFLPPPPPRPPPLSLFPHGGMGPLGGYHSLPDSPSSSFADLLFQSQLSQATASAHDSHSPNWPPHLPHLLGPNPTLGGGMAPSMMVPVSVASSPRHDHGPGLEGFGAGGCLGCLQVQLRHELRVAELLRLLSSNPMHGHHHLPHNHPHTHPISPGAALSQNVLNSLILGSANATPEALGQSPPFPTFQGAPQSSEPATPLMPPPSTTHQANSAPPN